MNAYILTIEDNVGPSGWEFLAQIAVKSSLMAQLPHPCGRCLRQKNPATSVYCANNMGDLALLTPLKHIDA